MSLAIRIAEIAQAEAERRGLSNLSAVIVQVGCLTDVSPEALELAFECARQETLAASANLVIERVPGIGECRQCGARVRADSLYFACPGCGSRNVAFESGDELQVVGLEVEDSPGLPAGAEACPCDSN